MDPITLIMLAAALYFVRSVVEDGVAAVRGVESPRITRRRARQHLAEAYRASTGKPPLGLAIAGRLAERIEHPPERRAFREFRAFLDVVIADAWEDARIRHAVRRDGRQAEWKRAQEQAREEAAAGRAAPDPTPPTAHRRAERRATAAPDHAIVHLRQRGFAGPRGPRVPHRAVGVPRWVHPRRRRRCHRRAGEPGAGASRCSHRPIAGPAAARPRLGSSVRPPADHPRVRRGGGRADPPPRRAVAPARSRSVRCSTPLRESASRAGTARAPRADPERRAARRSAQRPPWPLSTRGRSPRGVGAGERAAARAYRAASAR